MAGAGDVEMLPGMLGEEALVALAAGRGPLPERVAAVKELGRRGAPGGLRVLGGLLRDPATPTQLRSASALALGKSPGPENRAALETALTAEDPALLRHAATALGRVGGPEALARLRAVETPKDPAAQRALGFARSLIAYRHGLREEWLKPPAARPQPLDPGRAETLKPEPLGREAAQEIEARAPRELPALPVAPGGGVGFTCDGEVFALLPAEAVARATRASAVPAVLLKRSHSLEYFSVHLYLLSHPLAEDRLALFGVRPDGTLTHAGEARRADGQAYAFRLEALETPHARPMRIEGRMELSPPRLVLDAALVAATRAEGKATPRVPRRAALPPPPAVPPSRG